MSLNIIMCVVKYWLVLFEDEVNFIVNVVMGKYFYLKN